MFVSIDEVVAL